MALNQTDPTDSFEHSLIKALDDRDYPAVESLIQSARADGTVGEYWIRYAQAILTRDTAYKPLLAIGQLEALANLGDQLPNRLLFRIFNSLGISYNAVSQWDRSFHAYRNGLLLASEQPDSLEATSVLLNLSALYYDNGVHDQAIEYARRALENLDRQAESTTSNIYRAVALTNLALSQTQLGELHEADTNLNAALKIWQKMEHAWGQASVHENLGDIYLLQNRFEQAKRAYRRAIQIAEQVGNQNQLAYCYYLLALALRGQGANRAEVEEALDASFSLARKVNHHEVLVRLHLARAAMLEQSGDPLAALAENRRALAIVESLRANIVLPDDRARMTAARIEVYEKMTRRLLSPGTRPGLQEAFQHVEMAKSRGLNELLAGRPLRKPRNVPQDWLDQQTELRQELAALYGSETGARRQAAIQELERRLSDLRERIRLRDAEFSSFQTVDPLPLATIQARLPDAALLVEFFTLGDEILAFTITNQEVATVRYPLPLSKLARAFKQAGNDRMGAPASLRRDENLSLRSPWLLEKLYEQLILPLEGPIGQAKILCLVPHGLLHYVPFHALYKRVQNKPVYLHGTGQAPRAVLYAPSATTLLEYCQIKGKSPHQGALALGFDGNKLTQAEGEAAAVVAQTGGKLLNGSRATRENLFRLAGSYRYVHLSCHGWFNPTWPLLSSLDLADGTLDVSDIFTELELQAELVTLSACETGRARLLGGEELVGMTRAFLYAGTPSVLVSHWTVDELSTRLLMARFYQELENVQGKPAATALALSLSQAWLRTLNVDQLRSELAAVPGSPAAIDKQIDFLAYSAGFGNGQKLDSQARLLAHPYYWAPFTLVGDRL